VVSRLGLEFRALALKAKFFNWLDLATVSPPIIDKQSLCADSISSIWSTEYDGFCNCLQQIWHKEVGRTPRLDFLHYRRFFP